MNRLLIPLLSLASILAAPAQAADAVGFRHVSLDAGGNRPLSVALWFPAADPGGTRSEIGGNAAFEGQIVIEAAAPGPGARPLVVLSHGLGGSWRNLGWLAAELVRHGHVVAAPDHPGTTTFDRDPERARAIWERPRDVSRVIDALLADASLAGSIDAARIAAIGHSLGGWTAIALAGGRYDIGKANAACEAPDPSRLCRMLAEIGLAAGGDAEKVGADLSDRRIAAVVTLDLGPVVGLTEESLQSVRVPALVFAAGRDIEPIEARGADSLWLAERLPAATTTLVRIPDTTHFSFVQLCRPDGPAVIEAENPGESFVCEDGGERSRAAIHEEVADGIVSFLADTMPAR